MRGGERYGLYFGRGQIELGLGAVVVAVMTIFGMKRIDQRLPRWRGAFAILMFAAGEGGLVQRDAP